ncbi:MAG: TlyA family rRNA (cytidine-2'-O)-methyltransferase, partial [Clostridia bacterium]|nr:TlyA family rRNA (cytidine-2'-O)-methyltransferase [Clostridia bacterium]
MFIAWRDKLQKAFDDFKYDVKDKICVDIGASNGGFTDCMLQNGAKKVYAVDVGECAFDESLKSNPRVVVKDRIN